MVDTVVKGLEIRLDVFPVGYRRAQVVHVGLSATSVAIAGSDKVRSVKGFDVLDTRAHNATRFSHGSNLPAPHERGSMVKNLLSRRTEEIGST